VLLQIRDERVPLLQEQSCFIERCRVARGQISFINLAEEKRLHWRQVESAHAVLIGGAGGYSVTQNHEFTDSLTEIMHRLIEDDRPVFGSCWGHQFLASMRGGQVIEDLDRAEVGSFPIRLTDEGQADPLFEGFPEEFYVQLGHNDRVAHTGSQVVELARSELCSFQAIRLRDKPVYGSQFHSELNEERLRDRLDVYRSAYAADEAEYHRIIRNLRPSIWSDGLMARFLELYA
jgi:GMP synthase (glutamine-hydrolysing)